MADKIIDGVPDFNRQPDSPDHSGESTPRNDQDPHGIGGKARAMHDAKVNQQAKLPIALMRGGGVLLQGDQAIATLPDRLNMIGDEQERLEISMGGLRLDLVQRPHDYIERATEPDDHLNAPQRETRPRAQAFSLFVEGGEIVVCFDQPITTTPEISDKRATELLEQLDTLWTYLSSDEERATLADAKRLIEEVAPRTQQGAKEFKEIVRAKADKRNVSISLGRGRNPDNLNELGLLLTHTVEDSLASDSIRVTELIRDVPGEPAKAVDITEEGLFIPISDPSTLMKVSAGTHATINFDSKNELRVIDGKEGNPSTNGTAVARKMITKIN